MSYGNNGWDIAFSLILGLRPTRYFASLNTVRISAK